MCVWGVDGLFGKVVGSAHENPQMIGLRLSGWIIQSMLSLLMGSSISDGSRLTMMC